MPDSQRFPVKWAHVTSCYVKWFLQCCFACLKCAFLVRLLKIPHVELVLSHRLFVSSTRWETASLTSSWDGRQNVLTVCHTNLHMMWKWSYTHLWPCPPCWSWFLSPPVQNVIEWLQKHVLGPRCRGVFAGPQSEPWWWLGQAWEGRMIWNCSLRFRNLCSILWPGLSCWLSPWYIKWNFLGLKWLKLVWEFNYFVLQKERKSHRWTV